MKKVIIVLMIMLMMTGCGKNPSKLETPTNTTTDIVEIKERGVINDKSYDGIEITDISFNYDGEYSNMEFSLINKRETPIILNSFDVVVKDKDSNEIGRMTGYYQDEIQVLDGVSMILSLDFDFTKAYSTEFFFNNVTTVSNNTLEE